MLQKGDYSDDMLQENEDLFRNIDHKSKNAESLESQYMLEEHNKKHAHPFEISPLNQENNHQKFASVPEGDDEDIEDIVHITENDESLSLEKKEKELIIKALSKNNNKRKYAAQDLGISERTLYRKIKQYELDNS